MKLLVMSGGRHPYHESTPVLEGFLKGAGHDVSVTEDASVLTDKAAMGGYDALVFNTRRENLPDFGEWALSAAEQDGLKEYISSGNGFLCIHIAGCGPADWTEYHEITGGGWITGTSYHPPYSEMKVNVSNPGHAGTAGVADFSTNDELYMGCHINEGNDVFITGDAGDGTWPLGPQPRGLPSCPAAPIPLGWTRELRATARSSCYCWATTAAASRRRSSSK